MRRSETDLLPTLVVTSLKLGLSQLRLCFPSLELKPCQLLLRTKFGKDFGQLLQLWLCLPTLGLVCHQLRVCLPSLELKPCQLLLRTKFGKKLWSNTWTGFSPTWVVLIHSKSRASQTSVAPIFTGSEKIVETSDAHVWA